MTYDATDSNDDGVVEADVNNESVNTGAVQRKTGEKTLSVVNETVYDNTVSGNTTLSQEILTGDFRTAIVITNYSTGVILIEETSLTVHTQVRANSGEAIGEFFAVNSSDSSYLDVINPKDGPRVVRVRLI